MALGTLWLGYFALLGLQLLLGTSYLLLFLTLAAGVWLRIFLAADSDMYLCFLEKFGKSPDSLKGKTAWITGASSGIGEAIAVQLAKHGVRVGLSARSLENLDRVRTRCLEAGVSEDDVVILPLDVTDHSQHEKVIQAFLDKFKTIDILVSNAGRSQRAKWEEIQSDVDRSLFELNVFSLVALARVVHKQFKKQGHGHHVVTSSTTGRLGAPFSASYTASKHCLHGYFECLRTEIGSANIDITMLCPGPVESNLMQNVFTSEIGKGNADERSGKLMTADRCAYLSTVAIANSVPEAWIALQPVIIMHYLVQYAPPPSPSIPEEIWL